MATLYRPRQTTQALSRANISEGVAASSAQGLAQMGAQMISAGRRFQQSNALTMARQVSRMVDAQGEALFRESARAHQSALLMNKSAEAQESFVQRATERYRHTTDSEGNPTFQNLHSDIGNIGDEVMNDVSSTIIDPAVQRSFKQRFGNYVANQKVSALKRGMQQQVEYGISALDTGLGKLIKSSSADDIDQMGGYEQQGLESLKDAFEGGLISYEDFQRQSQEFSTTLRESTIQNNINSNRQRVREMLDLTSDELGLPEEKKQQLLDTLEAAERTDAAEIARAKERQEVDAVTEETAIVENLETRLEAGALREDELLSMKGKISAPKFSALKAQYTKEAKARQKDLAENRDIAVRIAEGQDISDVTPSKISKLHAYMTEQLADRTGQPVTLQQEAQLAAGIPAPVKGYATKLEQAVKFGDIKNAEDTLAAYTYIKDRKKPTLESSFDNEATAIMEHAELLVERAGIAPKEALAEARNVVTGVDDNQRSIREKLFAKEKAFKVDQIEETAASSLEGAESFFGTNRISADAVSTFRDFVKEGYTRSGNKDTAVAFASEMMNRTHGVSEVSGSQEYMFQPPEKVFPNYTSEQLRDVLVTEATPILPEGVSPDSIGLVADDLTAGQVQGNRQATTWVVTYEKTFEDGSTMEMPLINKETGQPIRWSPAGTKVFDDRREQQFQEAKTLREQNMTGLSNITNKPNEQRDKLNTMNQPAIKAITSSSAEPEVVNNIVNDPKGVLASYGINTPERKRHFLAQMSHESAGFRGMTEMRSDASAERKYGMNTRVGKVLGNTEPGDGAKFKGRGYIQLTGRYNYKKYGDKIGVDLVNNPELAADPDVALKIAAAYWDSKGLNKLADEDNIRAITKRINGGYNGLKDRIYRYNKLEELEL